MCSTTCWRDDEGNVVTAGWRRWLEDCLRMDFKGAGDLPASLPARRPTNWFEAIGFYGQGKVGVS